MLDRLSDAQEPRVAFMIGSALSLATGDGLPGVPGVDECVAIARRVVKERRSKALGRFDDAVRDKSGSKRYAAALDFVQRIGQDEVNGVVREATLRARYPSAQPRQTDALTESDRDGWALSLGTRALGELLATFPHHYPGPVLTTNFDPLLSVAVKRAGGQPHRIVFVQDRDPPPAAELLPDETQIIHLHGYWRDSDTMHTIAQLGAQRPKLERWCEEVLRDRLLLVVGYGGWDDTFTRMIGSLADPQRIGLQVVWAFYSQIPEAIIGAHAPLLEQFEQWQTTGRLRFATGIDAHVLFARLLDRMQPPAGAVAPSVTAGVVAPPGNAGAARLRLVRRPATKDSDQPAVEEAGIAASVTTTDPDGWSLLSAQQREWLASVTARLVWLLQGDATPGPSRPPPDFPPPAILRLRLHKVDQVLQDLGTVRPHEWPEIEWVLQLDEARKGAGRIVERLQRPRGTPPPSVHDPTGKDWRALADALERALAKILGLIRDRYPQAEPRP